MFRSWGEFDLYCALREALPEDVRIHFRTPSIGTLNHVTAVCVREGVYEAVETFDVGWKQLWRTQIESIAGRFASVGERF